MTYDALILDYDGVVVNILDKKARVKACLRFAREEFRGNEFLLHRRSMQTLAHSVSPEEVQSLSERFDTPPETLWRCRDDLHASVVTEAAQNGEKKPYPDVQALYELDVPVGIASNNQRRVVERITDEYGLTSRFETIHAREPVLESLKIKKPAPTFLRRAQTDLDASRPLYVGDKQKDIIAARRADMDVAFMRRTHNANTVLDYEPTYEVENLEDVVALFE